MNFCESEGVTIQEALDNEVASLIEQFDAFLAQDRVRNTTMFGEFTEVYLRKQLVPDRNSHICIGRIDIVYENLRGKGLLTRLLNHIEPNLRGHQGVEFECIHNPRLVTYLDKRGYEYPSFRPNYLKEYEQHRYIDSNQLNTEDKAVNPEAK